MLAADIAEHRRPVIEADADRQRRLAASRALGIPVRRALRSSCRRSASALAASSAPGVRQPEHGEDRVADVFLDRAAAGEDLRRHPLVELAQHRHHRFRRHGLGHPGEADDVDEQHGDGLPPHRAQRLVAASASISTMFGEK